MPTTIHIKRNLFILFLVIFAISFSAFAIVIFPKSRSSEFNPHEEKTIKVKNPYYDKDFGRVYIGIKESEKDKFQIKVYDGSNNLVESINQEPNNTLKRVKEDYYFYLYKPVRGEKMTIIVKNMTDEAVISEVKISSEHGDGVIYH